MRTLLLALCLCLAVTDTWGQQLPVAGQGDQLWVVRPESDNISFTVLHRHVSDAPGMLRVARESTGRLLRGGVATDGDRLWLIYESRLVQSLRGAIISVSGPTVWHWATRIEPSLPTGVQILSLAADRLGPWALVRMDNPLALQRIHQLAPYRPDEAPSNLNASDAPANPPAAEPTVADPSSVEQQNTPAMAVALPVDRLLRLERSQWKTVPLPAGWDQHTGAWVVMTGPGRDVPVLVQWLSASRSRGNSPSVSRLRLHRMISRSGMEEVTWESSEESLPGVGAVQALSVDGQVVVGQRVNQEQGIGLHLYLLRPEGMSELGLLTLPQVDAGATWTLVATDRSVALVTELDRKRWLWTAMNLRGQITTPPTELREQMEHPFNQILNHLVLVIVLVVATLMMFVFWKREPTENQVKLPKEMRVADFSTRVIAGLIDLSPCVGVAFTYFSVDWFTGLGQWPGRASGVQNMLPGAMAIGLYVLHTGLTELFTGRTLGKMICGLRVVDFHGRPPHVWQVLGRNALKTLDLIAWPLLILPIISPQRQRLGDMVAKTLVVIPTPPEPPPSPRDELDE